VAVKKKGGKFYEAIKCPYNIFKIWWNVTNGTNLINYNPLAIAALDYKNKSIGRRIINFILDYLRLIIGLFVLYQVLIPEI
jgi:hypothetical protein